MTVEKKQQWCKHCQCSVAAERSSSFNFGVMVDPLGLVFNKKSDWTCSRCGSTKLCDVETANRWGYDCRQKVTAERPKQFFAGWQCSRCRSKNIYSSAKVETAIRWCNDCRQNVTVERETGLFKSRQWECSRCRSKNIFWSSFFAPAPQAKSEPAVPPSRASSSEDGPCPPAAASVSKTVQSSLPPPVPVQDWFFVSGGQKVGPVSLEQLKACLASGQVQRYDLVWKNGFKEWVRAETVPELRR